MNEVTVSAESVQVDGRIRTLTVVQHRQPVPGPVPVILVFHGSMQTAAAIRSFTANTFDGIGPVVAYLDGHQKHWNDARIVNTTAARKDGVDDVAFAKAAIELLHNRYGGDVARVFAVGFSNGGQMVMRLIHEIPGALAGAAVLSATQPVPESFAPDSPQLQALPVMFVHGTKDPITPYEGGMAKMLRVRPRGLGLSAPATAAYYAQRNGITADPTTTTLSATVERTDYREPDHSPVTLYIIRGGGHSIPGPKKARPHILMGATDQTFDTVQAISDFFDLKSVKPSARG